MARPKNKENDILSAAMEVFLERGFSETSIQDIATKAGVGKGTIYDYFKSKEELFFQSLKQDILNISEIYKEKSLQQRSFSIRLMQFIDLFQEVILDNYKRFEYYMNTGIGVLSPENLIEIKNMGEQCKEESANFVVDILKQGIEEGMVGESDIRFSADMIQGMIFAHTERCFTRNFSEEQKKEEQVKLINMIMTGVGAK